ncbi:MAG: Sec-independent protein translocase protein TatB [Burkholderiales bacterium]|jgi:sec-independent protein translocase protein TatB|nr:Sec-independent protein translocase protein TatB [Burkholderiales bacterium]
MFDISFAQILIIALVAMVVIGPARLPKAVRTLGLLLGRAQRYVSEIKNDIQREMELEELRKVQQSIQDIGKDIEKSVQSVVQETEKTVKQAEGSVNEMESELNRIANDKPAMQAADGAGTQTAAVAEGNADSAVTAEGEAEPAVTAPAFLQGEVELSIPEASPESDRKPGE